MPSSSRALAFAALLVVLGSGPRARAQQPARGFAVDRLYPSAPGGGWLVMDELDLHGGLGGALGLTLGYASNPLRVGSGADRLAVVADEARLAIGAAITYRRWRFYLDLATPLATDGQSGVAGGYAFVGPSVTLGSNPDAISDIRVGSDVRILGRPHGRFRLGAGAQLWIPNGKRSEYDSDGTFRGMLRALVAGDTRHVTYAGQLGAHIRPLDDSPAPGSPKGSELLFGAAAGAKIPVGSGGNWVAIVGPEVYGATAFRSFLAGHATAVEALVTGRLEGTRDDRLQWRLRLGIGAGLTRDFGAADWRIIAGIELFSHRQPSGR